MLLAGILALVGIVFCFGLYACAPSFLVAMALPAAFLVLHIGASGGGNNLSVADLFLFVATLCALPLMDWRRAVKLKRWMMLVAIYQATTLLSVLNSTNRYDVVEWFHQLLMVLGAGVVGWVIVKKGRLSVALGGYILIASALSVWAIGLWLAHALHPIAGLPYGLQKNSLGVLFVVSVLAAHLVPNLTGLASRSVRVLKYLCLIGVIASGSRQAMIGLVVAWVLVTIRDGRFRQSMWHNRKSLAMVAILSLVAAAVYSSVTNEIANNGKINSFTVRTASYGQALQIWHSSSVFGVGERYWYTGHFPGSFQPPNAEIGILVTGGVVGLLGFLTLVLGSLRMLYRIPNVLGSFAFAVVVAHVIEGQFDIFWVTATGSVPWIALGMALASSGPGEDGGGYRYDDGRISAGGTQDGLINLERS